MCVLSRLLSTASTAIWTTLIGLTTAFTCYLFYRKQKAKQFVTYIAPNPCISCQSVVLNENKGIRTSTVKPCTSRPISLKTLKDIFSQSLKVASNNECFGTRADFTSKVKWISYEQVYQNVRHVGSALVYMSESRDRDEQFVGIYGRNAPEWVYTQQACANYGLITVPLYDTLGSEALDYILQQTEISIVVCDTTKRARNLLKRPSRFLRHIVVWQNEPDLIELRSEEKEVEVISFAELIASGKNHLISEKDVQPDDLCMICYTSGSTGLPKGVMYTHGQFVNSIIGATEHLSEILEGKTSIVHLSYLPLSHMMEQLAVNSALLLGFKIAFLTTDISGLMRDLAFYKPTLLCVVPRILTRMYTNAWKLYCANKMSRWLFQFAIRQKLAEQARNIYSQYGLLDSLYFKVFRDQMGGNIKLVVCGSAPISSEVLLFSRAVFSCPLIEGYGSTESGGVATMGLFGDLNVGHVGAISKGVQIKLADVPEMDIISQRDGMGEICVYSNTLTKGYYKDEAKTKELFDDDGFLRMGDIGCWTENGSLKIVDRCKNIFKLAQGEYVAPEKVEQIYGCSPLVVNVYVEGNSLNSFTVGVVVPDMKELRARLKHTTLFNKQNLKVSDASLSIDSLETPSDDELCSSDEVKQLILNELTKLGKQKGLNGFEQIKALYLTAEAFTIPNGLLTPTMKMARMAVRKRFSGVVSDLYKTTLIN